MAPQAHGKAAAAEPAADKKTELAAAEPPRGGTALAVGDFGEDAGAGMQDIDRSEYKIPFLRILDPKSPQCRPVPAGGLPGAKGGSILNTATNEIYDEILFVPAHRDHYYAEYLKRNDDGSGGGFVGIRPVDDDYVLQLLAAQGKFKKLVTNDQPPHEIAETFALTGLAIPCTTDPKTHATEMVGVPFPAVVAFASTQIKKYNTYIMRSMGFAYAGPEKDGKPTIIKPPIWAHVWHLTSQYERRGEQSWYGWVLRLWKKDAAGAEQPYPASKLGMKDPLYQAAKELNAAIEGGRAKADFAKAAPAEEQEIPLDP